MKVVIDNAREELVHVMDSVKKDKKSWEDWKCLHIELPRMESNKECVSLHYHITFILSGYMEDYEGNAYFCSYRDIFVFCKDAPLRVLTEVGRYVNEFVDTEANIASDFIIYDVMRDAEEIAKIQFARDENKHDHDIYSLFMMDALRREFFVDEALTRSPFGNIERFEECNVMLIDDDPVVRWMVRSILKEKCRFCTASNANKAVALYQKHQPDIVFLDIELPDKNGDSVLQDVLKQDPGAFVVMFSSFDSMDNVVRFMNMGAKGFISKPFEKEKLFYYIDKCCGNTD